MKAANATAARRAPPRRRWRLVAGGGGALALVVVATIWAMLGSTAGPAQTHGETALAVLDRLVVTITESGEIDAKKSVNVACEVEGQSPIIWVIEEGTLVKKGDKLIELDSAELREGVQTQDMVYKTAKAAFEKADKAYLISESTRESLMSEAGLTVKFGLMDFRKYLGNILADAVIAAKGEMAFDTLVGNSDLGGEALQQMRKLQSDIDLADEKLKRAASKLKWTQMLEEKGYVTGDELEADRLAWQTQQVALDQARTALDLFLKYEFPKAAEKAYTDWLEAKRENDRVDTRTQSELDTAQADRDTKKEALTLEEARLKKAQDQLAKTTILAPAPGMVVYDPGGGWRGQQTVIEAGSSVRHQQNLFKLPDMSEMNVKIKLHESVVKQASEGAPAFVTIDAFPKERLTGKVTKIAVMPDRGQMWLNPGLKNYVTEITLDAVPPGLKPGMSAQVEILVDTRDDVLQVPISAVGIDKGFQVVYVKTPTGLDTRRVEVGLSNERAVEITSGLAAGEETYLFKPSGAPELQVSEEEMKKANGRPDWEANGTRPREDQEPPGAGETPAAAPRAGERDGPRPEGPRPDGPRGKRGGKGRTDGSGPGGAPAGGSGGTGAP
ncbi:MAG: efflux RND transporter periplasmic adaptor subunit [Planctomycetes bacterium]|nr:efflux RND transporter periplasmic adaptor subunit [Planctomycetota bacterium]